MFDSTETTTFNINLNSEDIRLVPILGRITEQTGPVVRSPQYQQKWPPFHGDWLMQFKMSDSQQTVLTIAAVDKKNNPATLPPGSIQWAADNTDLLSIAPAADSKSCLVKAVGPLGTGTVSVKVLNTVGETIAAGSMSIEIDGGDAVAINVVGAEPTEQP